MDLSSIVRPAASPLLSVAFVVLPAVVAALFVVGVGRTGRGALVATVGTAAWMALGWGLAASGLTARPELRPPPFILMIMAILGGAFALGLSPLGRRLALGLPVAALVGVQAFRLPLELIMHRAATEGVMPVELSFSGYNFDIVVGASAIIVAALASRNRLPRWVLVGWNLLGLGTLTVIAVIAVMTSPIVRAFGNDPRHINTWVLFTPFVWLPWVLVLAALFGHILVVRRLRGTLDPYRASR